MTDHPIIQLMRQSVTLATGEESLIVPCFAKKKVQRNELLLHEGEMALDVFFVAEGGLQQYYLDASGNERTCNFTFENEFITDLESFSKKQPATCFIKALMPSTCYVINCADLTELITLSPATNEFFRKIVENVAAEGIRRTRSLQSSSPEKIFLDLLHARPDIFQRVPQRLIAQYVGIAPESLSRIKKRLMNHAKS